MTYIAECIKQREGGTPFTLTLSTASEKCLSVTSKLYSVKNYCHFLRWTSDCRHSVTTDGSHNLLIAWCTVRPPTHPIAHWTIRKISLTRAPTQVFVQQRNRSFTSLSQSFIKTTVSRGKHMSFRKPERMVSLSFCALGPIPHCLPNSLHVWPAFHTSTTYPSVYLYIHTANLPARACWTSRPTYLIDGAVSCRIRIEKCSLRCKMPSMQ